MVVTQFAVGQKFLGLLALDVQLHHKLVHYKVLQHLGTHQAPISESLLEKVQAVLLDSNAVVRFHNPTPLLENPPLGLVLFLI